jgi:CheY-like chemotaxis protein
MSLVTRLPGRTHRLLLVGDDRESSGLLFDALRHAGYEVAAAESADDALAAIATAAPDLAVLDIKMPGISGSILSELLRDQFNIPFVNLAAAVGAYMPAARAAYEVNRQPRLSIDRATAFEVDLSTAGTSVDAGPVCAHSERLTCRNDVQPGGRHDESLDIGPPWWRAEAQGRPDTNREAGQRTRQDRSVGTDDVYEGIPRRPASGLQHAEGALYTGR